MFARRQIPRVFDHPLAHFERQVQPGEAGVALLEALHDAQGVQVMVETLSEARHLAVELLLAGVGERRVADIVRQRQRLGQVFVQLEDSRQGARNLGYLDGVGQTVAEVIREARREHLGLGLQAPERAGMHHAIPVALEGVAVRVLGFRIAPPAASLHRESQARQHRSRRLTAATGWR